MNIFAMVESVSKYPTSIIEIPDGASGVHESILKAYHIVEIVKYMIAEEYPIEAILDAIHYMEDGK